MGVEPRPGSRDPGSGTRWKRPLCPPAGRRSRGGGLARADERGAWPAHVPGPLAVGMPVRADAPARSSAGASGSLVTKSAILSPEHYGKSTRWMNALATNDPLVQGSRKVRCVMLLHALAHNLL